jgi:hypothetical protein
MTSSIMNTENKFTERQSQFLSMPRVIAKPGIPVEGYYFIRGVRSQNDAGESNVSHIVNVNWRLCEEDAWEDMIDGNTFRLDLSFLTGKFSLVSCHSTIVG